MIRESKLQSHPQKVITVSASNFTPLFAELENLEDLAEVKKYLDKSIKKIMSIIKIQSKVHKPKTYKQAISNLTHTK